MGLQEQALDGQRLGTSTETHISGPAPDPRTRNHQGPATGAFPDLHHSHARRAGESLIQGNWLRMQTVRSQVEMVSQLEYFLRGAGPEYLHFTSSLSGDIMPHHHSALYLLQRVLSLQASRSNTLFREPRTVSGGSLVTVPWFTFHSRLLLPTLVTHVCSVNTERGQTSFSSTLHRPRHSPVLSCKRWSTTTSLVP